ncbi:MAG: hypothetical protein A2277_10270 [Desulfobacterales bacterium RIFOXYA12_FULL_46_15]|nr:MAG: hypothetical protein A2097_04525 [Desulfobacula sp. GWF2_41_7]OGR23424.1 MAG: hypothetical protein A2277_10270 [Desulfobacterales bacterium RIFOXYA12_FULL_46_15]
MKKNMLILCFFMVLFPYHFAHAKFPIHLGGFVLGDDISNYESMVDLKTFHEVPFNQYLEEGQIIVQPGFKSGLIAYGMCNSPKKVLRIKLKFSDSSKKFFERLLQKYREQLGEPDEYKGDPFQTMIAWKWSFVNDQKERISLILQHNIMVDDEKMGNSVKLTLTSRIDEERECYLKKFPEKESQPFQLKKPDKELWKLFVPY